MPTLSRFVAVLAMGGFLSLHLRGGEGEQDPEFARAHAIYAKEKWAEAATALTAFADRHPNAPATPQAWMEAALANLKLGKPDAAAQIFGWIIKRHDKTSQAAESLEQLFLLNQQKTRFAEADTYYKKLVSEFPKHPASVRLAQKQFEALMVQQKFEQAVAVLSPMRTELTPAYVDKLNSAQVFANSASKPEELLTAANDCLQQQKPVQAAGFLETFLRRLPSSSRVPEAQVKLGWCLYSTGDPKDRAKAEALWRGVIRKGPATSEWVAESEWHIVQLLAGPLAKGKDAVAECDKIAKTQQPGTFRHEQAVYTKAWLLWTQHDWRAAANAFDDLVKMYPDKAVHPPIVAYIQSCKDGLAKGEK